MSRCPRASLALCAGRHEARSEGSRLIGQGALHMLYPTEFGCSLKNRSRRARWIGSRLWARTLDRAGVGSAPRDRQARLLVSCGAAGGSPPVCCSQSSNENDFTFQFQAYSCRVLRRARSTLGFAESSTPVRLRTLHVERKAFTLLKSSSTQMMVRNWFPPTSDQSHTPSQPSGTEMRKANFSRTGKAISLPFSGTVSWLEKGTRSAPQSSSPHLPHGPPSSAINQQSALILTGYPETLPHSSTWLCPSSASPLPLPTPHPPPSCA